MPKLNTTTSGIITATLTADSSSSLELQENGVTVQSYGKIPAFRVIQNATSSLGVGAWTKVTYTASPVFDTNSNYSTSTSRFTPTVAGYYQINAVTTTNAAVVQVTAIYKNGSQIIRGFYTNTASLSGSSVSGIVYMNGSSDYLEVYTYVGTGTTTDGSTNTYFDGVLVRTA